MPRKLFEPGKSGNPGGRPRGILTVDQVRASVGKFLQMTTDELKEKVESRKLSNLDMMVASTIMACIKAGDFTKLDGLLNRVIGKTKEQIEMTIPKPYLIENRDGSVTELGSKVEED